jgi:hypothetical protein
MRVRDTQLEIHAQQGHRGKAGESTQYVSYSPEMMPLTSVEGITVQCSDARQIKSLKKLSSKEEVKDEDVGEMES